VQTHILKREEMLLFGDLVGEVVEITEEKVDMVIQE
jgi:hypothetical protein